MSKGLWIGAFVLGTLSLTPALSCAQSASSTADLQSLIDRYQSSSELVRPGLARQVGRANRRLVTSPQTASVRAQALIVLSQQAAREGRKNLARQTGEQAMALSATLAGPESRAVRGAAAVATSYALILDGEFEAAMRTIVAARRAHGPMQGQADDVWDELLLWSKIAQTSAPDWLTVKLKELEISREEAFTLMGQNDQLCALQSLGFVRNPGIGMDTVYPVNSGFSGLQGGVIMRNELGLDGKVIATRATAFAPTDGFAAAAEVAVATWSFKVPTGLPEICRKNAIHIQLFKIR